MLTEQGREFVKCVELLVKAYPGQGNQLIIFLGFALKPSVKFPTDVSGIEALIEERCRLVREDLLINALLDEADRCLEFNITGRVSYIETLIDLKNEATATGQMELAAGYSRSISEAESGADMDAAVGALDFWLEMTSNLRDEDKRQEWRVTHFEKVADLLRRLNG